MIATDQPRLHPINNDIDMTIYLALGSNLGDRQSHLRNAIQHLQDRGVTLLRASPAIETPALLPDDAPSEWNQPFLNMAIECEAGCTPEQLLQHILEIQNNFGRSDKSRWSPRPIDIDILLWGEQIISTDTLTIPHKDMHLRHFVLTPLMALNAGLTIPGRGNNTLLQWSQALPHHIPLWMGILNITPDSFSDGGTHSDLEQSTKTISAMVDSGATILDIGGESTRPGAATIDATAEWARVSPVLDYLRTTYGDDPLRPLVSLDTRNPAVAEKAIRCGIDFINDVSGVTNPEMIDLAANSDCQWIAMHNLSVPADPNIIIDPATDPVQEVHDWLGRQLEIWDKAGISRNRLIFDPGIGFGKNPLQSLKLLQAAGSYRQHGLRLLVGHSRKSFMKQFAGNDIHQRDMVTIGSALQLCQQGVDIIRVHNIPDHLAAYRGWAHLAG